MFETGLAVEREPRPRGELDPRLERRGRVVGRARRAVHVPGGRDDGHERERAGDAVEPHGASGRGAAPRARARRDERHSAIRRAPSPRSPACGSQACAYPHAEVCPSPPMTTATATASSQPRASRHSSRASKCARADSPRRSGARISRARASVEARRRRARGPRRQARAVAAAPARTPRRSRAAPPAATSPSPVTSARWLSMSSSSSSRSSGGRSASSSRTRARKASPSGVRAIVVIRAPPCAGPAGRRSPARSCASGRSTRRAARGRGR